MIPFHVLLEAFWGDVDTDLAEVALPVSMLCVQVVVEALLVGVGAELPPTDGAGDDHVSSPSYHLNVEQRVRKGKGYMN